jgi:hypothetical protein
LSTGDGVFNSQHYSTLCKIEQANPHIPVRIYIIYPPLNHFSALISVVNTPHQHFLIIFKAITRAPVFLNRPGEPATLHYAVAIGKLIGFFFRLGRTNLHITQSHVEYPFKGSA